MDSIRIVWGTGDGPTEMASYDAALADAGVHNYNLVSVSSMIPAGAEIEVVGTAGPLGPPGERLTVVEARTTAAGGEASTTGAEPSTSPDSETELSTDASAPTATAPESETLSASIGWVRSEEGPGLFYEAAGRTSPDAVSRRVLDGLAAGQELRDWSFGEPAYHVQSADVADEGYTTAVVLAVYGQSEPLL